MRGNVVVSRRCAKHEVVVDTGSLKIRRLARTLAILISGIPVLASGCTSMHGRQGQAFVPEMPRELNKVTMPQYRIEPPDILLIQAVNNIRPADTQLEIGDELLLKLSRGLPFQVDVDPTIDPLQYELQLQSELQFKVIDGTYVVNNRGEIDLGPAYGAVQVEGLTVEDARAAVTAHLAGEEVGLVDPDLSMVLLDPSGKQPISGEHLVRQDGTVSLGIYGEVPVAGLTLMQARAAIESYLSHFMVDPEVNVDVLAYNSKVYYVIVDGGGFGESVIRLPITGNETVLDAIANIEGLPEISSKKMWIARPAPGGFGEAQILDVHWRAIAAEGITTTNYQLLPGDRLYVKADHLIATDNFISKLTAPVERVFGSILLGTGVAQGIDFYEAQGTRGF